jgi:hypothetical protein
MFLKFRLLFPLLVLLSSVQASEADELLLEGGSQNGSSGVAGSFQGPFGGGVVSFVELPPGRTENNTALKLEFYHSTISGDWGVIYIKEFNSILDLSDYQQLEFSFYSEGNDSIRSVAVQLYFGTQENSWIIKDAPLLSAGFNQWKTIQVPLSEANFERNAAFNESNVFDLTQVQGIGFLVLNNLDASPDPSSEQPVYLDDVKVTTVTQTLSVDTDIVKFGNLEPKPDKYRFESDPLTVSYSASSSEPWEIRIYTSNDNGILGLVDENNNNIPIKVDPGADNDADNDLDWSGDPNDPEKGPEFLFVLNDDTRDDSGNPFYTKIASSANENPPFGSVRFNFAIDASGVPVGTYSANMTVELFIED